MPPCWMRKHSLGSRKCGICNGLSSPGAQLAAPRAAGNYAEALAAAQTMHTHGEQVAAPSTVAQCLSLAAEQRVPALLLPEEVSTSKPQPQRPQVGRNRRANRGTLSDGFAMCVPLPKSGGAIRHILPAPVLPTALPLIVVALSLQGAAQPLCWAIVVPGHLTQHQKSLKGVK